MKRGLMFLIVLLATLTLVPFAFADPTISFIEGDHYAGMGWIQNGASGPFHAIVNTETNEIIARVKPWHNGPWAYGFPSEWTAEVKGEITDIEVIEYSWGTMTNIRFDVDEFYYRGVLKTQYTQGRFQVVDYLKGPSGLSVLIS